MNLILVKLSKNDDILREILFDHKRHFHAYKLNFIKLRFYLNSNLSKNFPGYKHYEDVHFS